MAAQTFRAIPAAAGYPQFSGTSLIPPIFSTKLLERFYCTSIFSMISSSDYFGELNGRGDQIVFMREPCVRIHDYIKDGALEHDTPEVENVVLVIDRAKYFSFKIDNIDKSMIARWKQIEGKYIENASRAMSSRIDCEMLGLMFGEASCSNRGPSAGVQSGAYNLGQTGNPVTLTSANIIQYMSFLKAVLDEQCLPETGRFLVVPPTFGPLLMNSPLSAAYFAGNGPSQVISGKLTTQIMGFDIYISNCAPNVLDAAVNARCYYVIAGLPMATAFASVFEETRTMSDVNHFATYMQGMMAYGFDTLFPEAIASLYFRQ